MSTLDADGVPFFSGEMHSVIPRLRRYALSLTRNEDEADDLVHDCLLRAMENQARWQPGTCLRAWMLVIMRNIYFNKMRHLKYVRKAEPELHLRGSASIRTQAQDIWLELVELQRAVNKLPAEQREVLMLTVVEELSYKTVADTLRIPIGTVRSRLARARAKLAVELAALHTASEEPPGMRRVSERVREGSSQTAERIE